jgi:CHAT domain-containing protein/tetratricopeptide (TPR) repeat protein
MPKKIPDMWFLGSIMSLCVSLAAAQPTKSNAALRAAVEAPTAKKFVADQEELRGVVIDEVPKGSALEKAGLRVGDVILNWERLPNPPANPEAASGKIETPLDWMWLEIEQAPRGVVRLTGEREGKGVLVEVPMGTWGGVVSLDFSKSKDAPSINGCDKHIVNKNITLSIHHPSTKEQDRVKIAVAQCTWNRLELARQLAMEGNWPKAKSLLATPPSSNLPPRFIALTNFYIGKLYQGHGDLALAHRMYSIGLRYAQRGNRESLLVSLIEFRLGSLELTRSNLRLAQKHYDRAIQQLEQIAPNSLELARNLRDRGLVEEELERYDQALKFLNRSLEIATNISPAGSDVATIINDIGVVNYDRGDLLLAEDNYQAAAALKKAKRPGDVGLAGTYSNIGIIRASLGDFEAAEHYYLEALKIIESSHDTGARTRQALQAVLTNLADVLNAQGDFEGAELYLEQAAGFFDRETNNNLDYALLLKNIGNLAWEQENFTKTREYYQKALRIWEKKSPNGPGVASCLEGLGILEVQRKNFIAGNNYLTNALRQQERVNPESLRVANVLNNLGNLEDKRGRHEKAKKYWARALRLRSRIAPGSELEAKLFFAFGEAAFREGNLGDAMVNLSRSIESMERQFDQLGDDDLAGGRYRFKKSGVYRLAARIAAARGDDAGVFFLSERYRARGFLDFFTRRIMRFYPDLPEKLDLERQRLAILLRRKERALSELASSSDRDRMKKLLADAHSLETALDAVGMASHKMAPRLASLEKPKPLAANDAVGALDEGTAMISYFDCGDQWYVMFLGMEHGRESYHLLHLGSLDRQQVISLIRALAAPASGGWNEEARARRIEEVGGLLYRLLLEPLDNLIAASSRLLIIPDGPLHYLPWGALLREYEEDGIKKHQYLAEWKPYHIALSATVFAEIKKDRRPSGATPGISPVMDFIAFGDPMYPSILDGGKRKSSVDFRVHSAARRELLDLTPLPWSRQEVEGIAALFPPGHAQVFLGAEATEETVKKVAKGARILHFATHAQVDDRFPLNSAVALTIPEALPKDRENGLLQVWEIFESVRLDADLVVLSGCKTALGEDQGGEGLIGLTRAFQYAGARTVMASLWSVNDQATAELMIRFYKHLRAGMPKDQALQAAQQELIAGPIEVTSDTGERVLKDFRSPYYWAGFQIYGDWQ